MRCTIALIALALLAAGCAQAPVTGRQQLILLPQSQISQIGAQAAQQVVQEKGVAHDARLDPMIQRVGTRIARVSDMPNLNWRFVLINDDTPNAFALPDGFVGVHTGLFDVIDTEDQLAAIIGHEIGHVTAQHHNERLSRQTATDTAVSIIAGQVSPSWAPLLAQAATLGVVLPFTREQEAESDHIGIIYMARAGYNPQAAVEVWQRFETMGGAPPEFLSTHPSPGNRIEELQRLMPEAMAIYRQNAGS
jgi:predicted Zn-dependent protease